MEHSISCVAKMNDTVWMEWYFIESYLARIVSQSPYIIGALSGELLCTYIGQGQEMKLRNK